MAQQVGKGKRYALNERVFMVRQFYQIGNKEAVCREFRQQFGHDTTRKTVRELVQKFEETGSVLLCFIFRFFAFVTVHIVRAIAKLVLWNNVRIDRHE